MQVQTSGATSRWIGRKLSLATPAFRLFCFPYAGGGSAVFRDWPQHLGADVEVCPIQLPGREARYAEPALRRSEDVVDMLVPELSSCSHLPFALFGHSMGALLAYETVRGLARAGAPLPRALFVSGHRAPHLPRRKRNLYQLPRDEFIHELRALNGTPAEVFENDELVQMMLPTLRSDFELVETYVAAGGLLLSCPVIAMGGLDDPDVRSEELGAWRAATHGRFELRLFPGDHFYLNSARAAVLQSLQLDLAALEPD